MNKYRLIFWSITAALAGFLFGFDTVVISGADTQIQNLWSLSGFMHGWAMSAALWGTVAGALLGGIPTARLGRKKTLVGIGLLYLVSAIASAVAGDVILFIIARFIGGLGVGVSTVVAPLYISEIAPAKDRGKLTGMYQFNIVFGILIAFMSNYFLGGAMAVEVAWRWMLGIEAVPALIYCILVLRLPESPRWLITHAGKRKAGAEIFRQINPEMSAKAIDAQVREIEATKNKKETQSAFWSTRLKLPISLAFFIAFFNQLSGINVILYFAPRILKLAGIEDPLAAAVSLGVTNLIFTFVGLWLIDKLGRRTLLYIGSVGYIISLGLCSLAFSFPDALGSASDTVVLACILGFIAAHAVGQGAVIWVFISEIFPNQHRAAGQSLGSSTHWVFAASLTFLFPIAIERFDAGVIFGFFCFMMMLQLIWVKSMVPETKGISLEEIESKLA